MGKRLEVLEKKFLDTIKENNLIESRDKIIVGVSGGPDSLTLLECLKKYQNKLKCDIVVCHVNHKIREDADDDEDFVRQYCKENDIKFYSKQINIEAIAKKTKRGTEETGRIERYRFFDEIAKKENVNKIAIAHNMNDNAETMLLNLIRGTGTTGLEGIQAIEQQKYIRPLINCSRNEIEEYCEKHKLNPRIDSTNSENIYTRNIVRNKIIPELQKINPSFIEAMSRTSKIIKENNDFIQEETDRVYGKIATKRGDGSIEITTKEFSKNSAVIKKNIIIRAIKDLTKTTRNVEKVNIDDALKMAEKNIGNKHMFINKNVKIVIENSKIIFTRKDATLEKSKGEAKS